MWFEHWHRYRFIAPLVADKRVVDVACGEGYGSDLLAATATTVVGVDISANAVAHARETYPRNNLSFQVGACTAIAVADASIDVLVSFETLEHITEHELFLREIKRALSATGWAVISTPNKAEYSDARGYQNEFHLKELYREQFAALLSTQFKHVRWFTQRNGFHSMIAPEVSEVPEVSETYAATVSRAHVDATMRIESMPERAGKIAPPLYYLAFVANDASVLDALPLTMNAFTAFEDNQVDVFMQIWRHSQHLEQKISHLEAQLKAQIGAQPGAQLKALAES